MAIIGNIPYFQTNPHAESKFNTHKLPYGTPVVARGFFLSARCVSENGSSAPKGVGRLETLTVVYGMGHASFRQTHGSEHIFDLWNVDLGLMMSHVYLSRFARSEMSIKLRRFVIFHVLYICDYIWR